MTGRISVFLALCVLSAAVVAAIALRGSESQASHLDPVPSFHVDIGDSAAPSSTGNDYIEDQNDDGFGEDQLMSVITPLTPCVRRDVSNFDIVPQTQIITDIIIQNADEMEGADVRINFNPDLIKFVSADLTPFKAPGIFGPNGWTEQEVGLINLPLPPYSGTARTAAHRGPQPAFADDNVNGAVFLAGTYDGNRLFESSSESGPDVDSGANDLPNRNVEHAPDGGVFVRIIWRLQAASSGQDVRIDLKTGGPSFTGGGDINAGTAFLTLTGEAPGFTDEIVAITGDELFDGVVSVNKEIPEVCPPPSEEVEPTPVPGFTPNVPTPTEIPPTPTSTPRPTARPTATATSMPGPGTPTATPVPTVLAEEQAPGGVPSTGNPGAAGGSGGDWLLYALAASLLLVAVSGSGLLWMSRRRIAWPWRRNHSGG